MFNGVNVIKIGSVALTGDGDETKISGLKVQGDVLSCNEYIAGEGPSPLADIVDNVQINRLDIYPENKGTAIGSCRGLNVGMLTKSAVGCKKLSDLFYYSKHTNESGGMFTGTFRQCKGEVSVETLCLENASKNIILDITNQTMIKNLNKKFGITKLTIEFIMVKFDDGEFVGRHGFEQTFA